MNSIDKIYYDEDMKHWRNKKSWIDKLLDRRNRIELDKLANKCSNIRKHSELDRDILSHYKLYRGGPLGKIKDIIFGYKFRYEIDVKKKMHVPLLKYYNISMWPKILRDFKELYALLENNKAKWIWSPLPSGIYFHNSGSAPYVCRIERMEAFKNKIENGDLKDSTLMIYTIRYDNSGDSLGICYRAMPQKFIMDL